MAKDELHLIPLYSCKLHHSSSCDSSTTRFVAQHGELGRLPSQRWMTRHMPTCWRPSRHTTPLQLLQAVKAMFASRKQTGKWPSRQWPMQRAERQPLLRRRQQLLLPTARSDESTICEHDLCRAANLFSTHNITATHSVAWRCYSCHTSQVPCGAVHVLLLRSLAAFASTAEIHTAFMSITQQTSSKSP